MRIRWLLVFLGGSFLAHAQDIEVTPEGHEIMRVYFAGGSYFLDNGQRKDLHDWLLGKNNLHEFDIYLQSHTDHIGSLEYNQFLSRSRSQEVLMALEQISIPKEEVRIKDFGETDPDYDNATWQGRLLNRRVDIILVPPSS